jgi:phage head maturation protease
MENIIDNITIDNLNEHLEYRFAKDITVNADKNLVEGTAIVFNQPSEIILEQNKVFREQVLPSAVPEDWLKTQTIYMRYLHNPATNLARYSPNSARNSLHFTVDSIGVHYSFRAKQSDMSIVESIQNGDLDACSFCFALTPPGNLPGEVQWSRSADGVPLKTIKKFAIIKDFSIVERGAYPNANVSVRSYDAFIQSELQQRQKEAEDTELQKQLLLQKEQEFQEYYKKITKKYLYK